MTAIRQTIAAALFAVAGLAATAAQAGEGTFDVEANSTFTVEIEVCHQIATIDVVGDGDTDLDFYLYDAAGNLIFADEDLTDWTNVLVKQTGEGCQSYEMDVVNYGSVYNRFRVVAEGV